MSYIAVRLANDKGRGGMSLHPHPGAMSSSVSNESRLRTQRLREFRQLLLTTSLATVLVYWQSL